MKSPKGLTREVTVTMSADKSPQLRFLLSDESDDAWDSSRGMLSDDGSRSDSLPGRCDGFENPASYGLDLKNLASQGTIPRQHSQYFSTSLFQQEYECIANTERLMGFVELDLDSAAVLNIPNGWRASWDRRMRPIKLPFPRGVFEIDTAFLPYPGYIFDPPSFGFWIYRCAQQDKTFKRLDAAWCLYDCLYRLGFNEVKARSMIDQRIANDDLWYWLYECSRFVELLQERAAICYDRVPEGGTECYPGVLIARFLFGSESQNWTGQYIEMITRSNKNFAIKFRRVS